MAASNKQPKIMSSRLNNMKFMQRAGASTSSTPSEPPSKRQRLSNGSAVATTAAASYSNTPTDASRRGTTNQAESKWYLSFKAPQPTATESPLRIVTAGYSALDAGGGDSSDDGDDDNDNNHSRSTEPTRAVMPGRQSFGKFNRKLEKQQNQDQSPSSSSESASDEDQGATGNDDDDDEDDDDDDDPTGVNALIKQGRKEATERARAERKAKKAADLAESQRLAEQRRNREINLNEITSISNSGSSSANPYASMTCYNCEQKGHRSSECPKKRSGRPSKLMRR